MDNKIQFDLLSLEGRFLSIKRADIRALIFIQRRMRTCTLDVLMRFFTRLGNGGTVWLCAACLMCFSRDWRECAVQILSVLAVGFLTGNLLIKRLSARIRPYDFLNYKPLIKPLPDYSFPSCHSMSSFACAVTICFFSGSTGAAAVMLASLIAFSRIYLFVHYPSDVAGGSLWGVTIALLNHWLIAPHLFARVPFLSPL